MRTRIVVYIKTVLGGLAINMFPWIMAETDFSSKLSVLESYSVYAGIIALLLIFKMLIRYEKNWKYRVLLFMINPSVYYFIGLMGVRYYLRYAPK